MIVTIWHNPACGTSVNTLAMIRASDEEPVIIDYPTNPPIRTIFNGLIAAGGITLRERLTRTQLCRPFELVTDLFDDPVMEFTKEHTESVRWEEERNA